MYTLMQQQSVTMSSHDQIYVAYAREHKVVHTAASSHLRHRGDVLQIRAGHSQRIVDQLDTHRDPQCYCFGKAIDYCLAGCLVGTHNEPWQTADNCEAGGP